MITLARIVFVFFATVLSVTGSQGAQDTSSPPPTLRMPIKRMPPTQTQPAPGMDQAQIVNPDMLPLEIQVSQLREQLEAAKREFAKQLEAARREIQDLQARYQRHGHQYVGLGNIFGLPADQFETKSVTYRDIVILGGKGVPGNQGPVYRSTYRTSEPVE